MSNREEILAALTEWQQIDMKRVKRQARANMRAREERARLLVQAREAGLTNKQIAEALNGPPPGSKAMLRFSRCTTQKVTALMAEADNMLANAVYRLVRDAERRGRRE